MKNIIKSLLMIGVVSVTLTGVTRAWFTSRVLGTTSTLQAGTLSIAANNSGGADPFSINLGTVSALAPGETTGEASITVRNTGSLPAATFGRFVINGGTGLEHALKIYDYKVQYFKNGGAAVQRWATHDNYFGSLINEDYFVKDGVMHPSFIAAGGKQKLVDWMNGNGPLDFTNGKSWDMEALNPGAYYVLTFKFQMDPEAGNGYQGKTVSLGYEIKATQINGDAMNALNLGVNNMQDHVTYLNGQLDLQ